MQRKCVTSAKKCSNCFRRSDVLITFYFRKSILIIIFSSQVEKKTLLIRIKKNILFSVKKCIVIGKKYVLISMQLFSFTFLMLSAKSSCQEKKHLLINMQIYARNSCAGQKHRGRWRLISCQMFASTHLCSPFYVD